MAIRKKKVDVVPEVNLTGDFTKWVDTSIAGTNSKINALMTFLEMEQGTLSENPDCGGKDYLIRIYHSSESEAMLAVNLLEAAVKRFLDLSIQLTGQKNPLDAELLDISIMVTGLPGTVRFGLQKRKNVVMIVSPQLI